MILTIATCGKNDDFAGNFVHRLELCLNKLIQNIDTLSLQDEVEILVTDWGSEDSSRLSDVCDVPYRKYLKFIYVSPDITRRIAPDSNFSVPHAMNAAARRMSGENFMYIDGDTFIPTTSFKGIIDILKSKSTEYVHYWASRYLIPYKIQSEISDIYQMEDMLSQWKNLGKPIVATSMKENGFVHSKIDLERFGGGACACLLDRNIVFETGFLLETLTRWGWMDVEAYNRISTKYKALGDLEIILGSEFYHIGHHEKAVGHDVHGFNPFTISPTFKANGEDWGLASENLEIYTKK